jgi:hypothetical protein
MLLLLLLLIPPLVEILLLLLLLLVFLLVRVGRDPIFKRESGFTLVEVDVEVEVEFGGEAAVEEFFAGVE